MTISRCFLEVRLSGNILKNRRRSVPRSSSRRHATKTLAVAAEPNLNDAHSIRIRAQRLNQRLNEELWQERLRRAEAPAALVPPPALRAEALSECKWKEGEKHMSIDSLWHRIREEAYEESQKEPVLASFLHMTVIMHSGFEKSLAFVLANKLSSATLLGTQLTRLFLDAYADDSNLLEYCIADLQAVFDRDPACEQYLQCLLFFKGFQAIQVHRVAHWMWLKGRKSLALALQSRMSEVFGVDIHPGAVFGKGMMMDHATGIVIGETAVIGDNVSMLHHVTLGGSGTGTGTRHPTVGNGALLGAGVSVLGPVVVGHCSKVGAGSVVVTDIPSHCVAVGVPARVVKRLSDDAEPTKDMDQIHDFIFDYVI